MKIYWVVDFENELAVCTILSMYYGRPERKWPSLHGRKFNPTPNFLGKVEAYFVCHNGPIFQISLIYAFIAHFQLKIQSLPALILT